MDEKKDIIPEIDEEKEVKTEEVVAEVTADNAITEADNTAELNGEKAEGALSTQGTIAKKAKKKKEPMPKKKKIIVITAAATLGAILLGFFIWLMVFLFGPGATQALSTTPLSVDMADLPYYVGTEGTYDPSKVYTDGKVENGKLTYKQDGKTMTKDVVTIDGAVNVSTFEELAYNINAGNKVVIQNANLKAPKLEGVLEDNVPTMTVKNDVYGNGATINVNEIVATRVKGVSNSNKKLSALTNGLDYKKGTYGTGYSVFTIVPTENGKQVVFQDVHVTGNDMSTAEDGNLAGLTEEQITERGVKLFSGYGALLFACGNDEAKTNALVKHCVFENAGKVVHINNANIDIEGCIVRNAADTAVSIATEANKASTINMKNNVIVNSLTGGILFYCMDKNLTEDNAAASWNTLNIQGFLDIYNWKQEKNLAFLPETEGATLANIANGIVKNEIPKSQYEDLKVNELGQKYIHFAIIKIRTCDFGQGNSYAVKKNGSKVTGLENVGFTDSAANGQQNGFPIPDAASVVMLDIDVWGYYGNGKGAVSPTASFEKVNLSKLYKELVEGR